MNTTLSSTLLFSFAVMTSSLPVITCSTPSCNSPLAYHAPGTGTALAEMTVYTENGSSVDSAEFTQFAPTTGSGVSNCGQLIFESISTTPTPGISSYLSFDLPSRKLQIAGIIPGPFAGTTHTVNVKYGLKSF
jgi:hypothetical protein